MARKKGSKRARYFWGGRGGGSFGGVGFSQEAADNIKKGALLAQQDAKPAATKTVQPATGAQSARDFAPEVEGAGTQYIPPTKENPKPVQTGPITDEVRQEQALIDKRSQQILKESGVAAQGLSPEEYNTLKENLGAWLNLPENRAYRDTSTAVGKVVDKLGGPAGLFALTAGGIMLAGGAFGGAGSAAAGGGATGGGAAAAEAAALAQAGVPSSALGAYGTGAAAGTAGAVGGAGAALGGASAAEAAALSAAGVPASGLAAYGGAAGAGGILGTGLTAAGLAKGAAVAGGAALAADALIPDGQQQEADASQQTGIETMVDQAPDKKPAPTGLGDPTSQAYMGRPEAVETPQIDVGGLAKVEAGPASTVEQMAAQTPVEASQAKAGAARAAMSKVAQAKAPAEVGAATMEAVTAEAAPAMEAAQGQVSEQALASVDAGTITQPAVAAQRDAAAEQAAMAQAAQRPEARDYAEAVTGGVAAQVEDIEGPAVITREGATISKAEVERLGKIAQGRGINLQDLPEYKDVIQKRVAQQGEAATAQYRDMLGQAPEAQAAQAQFIEAGPTPEMAATQISSFEDLAPARREAYTTMGVSAPEAAQMESVRQAQAASRQAITASSSPQALQNKLILISFRPLALFLSALHRLQKPPRALLNN